jgi:membrane-associated phospholipid phosphatase
MTDILRKLRAYWQKQRRFDRFLIIASLPCLGAFAFLLFLQDEPYSPDLFYVFALVIALIGRQGRDFIKDWTPPTLLLLAYEYLGALIPKVNPHVHYYFMAKFDTFLFGGQLPTVWLQHLLYNPNDLQWYDYVSAFLYSVFFAVPLVVALILWFVDREGFERYVFGMVGLSYLAYFTYLVYPAAPPWLAAQRGIIPPLVRVSDVTYSHFSPFIALPTVYKYIPPNLTAAVPSLHAAYPFFTPLFLRKKYPKAVPFFILYAAGVTFAVIYLGEHYFFDVALGLAYAYLAYLAVTPEGPLQRIISRLKKRPRAVNQ